MLDPYPEAERLQDILSHISRREREVFVRLWLTEGIPYAFRECPAIYEDVRGWLGNRLELHPKQITLLGSARIGFSMARPPQFGREFNRKSDLDFAIISTDLFVEFEEMFNKFKQVFFNSEISPRNETEREYWENNIDFGEKNIPLRFFDANKIPYFNRFPIAQKVGQAMWVIIKKLKATDKAPESKKASVRVYKDWESLINRVSLNLYWVSKN